MKSFRKFINKRRQSYQQSKQGGNSSASASAPAPAPASAPAPAPVQHEVRAAAPANNQQVLAQAAPGTLQVALQNKSSSSNAYAYITGLGINNNNKPLFIQSNGSVYYPDSPSKIQSQLQADVAIPLGAPGNTVNVFIPKIAGGRIWFSIDAKLTFLLNPGPAVVEPSVSNPSDPNFNINWTFTEFTYNDAQLFANISYVDFVSIPIALSLTNTQGKTQTVPGMNANGLQTVVNELRAQAQTDGRPWDKLVYQNNGQALRVLSPNNLLVGNANAWGNYWDAYTQAVWNKYRNEDLTINTQAAAGNLTGRVVNNELQLGQAGNFGMPSAQDIFSCSTGPFATGSNQARNAVIPRLAAAFNRSTLLNTPGNQFPNGSNPSMYYLDKGTTNHYSRVVHQVQKDGRGYAFPYDDVVPNGGQDVAGTLFDGSPQLFTIAVGGN
ncbi:glycoside hydrolase family 64 protein [Dothidotthia symphoricarpi CBS 119687]|uniref:Glycoside hydrolase family 64 protein n=1 Tax=Dothidotthia symphoricarpi CBS 119687 TaxID=1392245 RepID=A0A6A6AU76_9PLEO|nr:glycoside hydrolase family 64 protein [Dothidotthia symphoricarpi CBS 119687]KAF2134748.1 glycoside hydrolase family 64 protein [Dothidotthia symphoricarpi CBS 119687]